MKKVAILVPTKDRLDFVIRLINYYVSINSTHTIFIGDASIESFKEQVLNASKGKVEVYYFHWKNLSDRKTMINLAMEANSANISNYCAFHGDDDFFIPDSLSMCAEFLDENPEYSTAQGRAFTFELKTDSAYGELKSIGKYWDVKELNGNTSLDRLKEIASNYWVPLFSVQRIDEFIDSVNNGIETVVNRSFGEYINSLSIAMGGKSKFVDCLYLARGIHNKRLKRSTLEWVTEDDWHLSYNEVINSLSKLLSKNDSLRLAESDREATLALEQLTSLDKPLQNSTRSFIIKKYSECVDSKKGLVYKLSQLYRIIKYISISPPGIYSHRYLAPRSKYYKDVSLIINSCRKIAHDNLH